MPRLLEEYRNNVLPSLMEHFSYKNRNQTPRLEKIVVSMGIGSSTRDKTVKAEAIEHLKAICGQRPITTQAKKSIAGFKLRQGMTVGLMVTLRGAMMYEFFDRLVNVAIPRIRDFRGVSPNLDGRGNYNLGIEEIVVLHEVNMAKGKIIKGLNGTICTTAKTDEEGRELLQNMAWPCKTK